MKHTTQRISRWFWGLVLCLSVTSTADTTEIPNATNLTALSLDEVRQCRIEAILLQGEATVLDPHNFWQVHDYNKHLEPFKSTCRNRNFDSTFMAITNNELTSLVRDGIEKAGARRFLYRQIGRDHNRLHVVSERTSVYISNQPEAVEIGELLQWEELFTLSNFSNNRVQVEWIEAMSLKRKTGWLAETAVRHGDGTSAREKFCRAHRGSPVKDHELIQGETTSQWSRVLRVDNRSPSDAFVKLVRENREVTLAFLVKGGYMRSIAGIPNGVYDLHFITGAEFSRGCASFASRGFAGKIDQKLYFDNYGFEWEVALNAPPASNSVLDIREYSSFDAL